LRHYYYLAATTSSFTSLPARAPGSDPSRHGQRTSNPVCIRTVPGCFSSGLSVRASSDNTFAVIPVYGV
jgi:hypothetical protein